MKEEEGSVVWAGAHAQAFRVSLGLSQNEFARATGLPLGTVATLERRGTLSAPMQYVYRSMKRKVGDLPERMDALRVEIKNALSS